MIIMDDDEGKRMENKKLNDALRQSLSLKFP